MHRWDAKSESTRLLFRPFDITRLILHIFFCRAQALRSSSSNTEERVCRRKSENVEFLELLREKHISGIRGKSVRSRACSRRFEDIQRAADSRVGQEGKECNFPRLHFEDRHRLADEPSRQARLGTEGHDRYIASRSQQRQPPCTAIDRVVWVLYAVLLGKTNLRNLRNL